MSFKSKKKKIPDLSLPPCIVKFKEGPSKDPREVLDIVLLRVCPMQTQILALTFSLIKFNLIWDQKVQCNISDSLLPTYLCVCAHLCVCTSLKKILCHMSDTVSPTYFLMSVSTSASLHAATHQRWAEQPNIGGKRSRHISNTLSPTIFFYR